MKPSSVESAFLVTGGLLIALMLGILLGSSTGHHSPAQAWEIYVEAQEKEFSRHYEAMGRGE